LAYKPLKYRTYEKPKKLRPSKATEIKLIHVGTLEVESVEGRGTEFIIRLPFKTN